jgi:hypothetical protein
MGTEPKVRKTETRSAEAPSWADQFLDMRAYFPEVGQTLSLKVIFDNLRCYPLLILFGLGIKSLRTSATGLDTFAAYLLAIPFIVLLLGVVVQTSFMVTFIILAPFRDLRHSLIRAGHAKLDSPVVLGVLLFVSLFILLLTYLISLRVLWVLTALRP